jgi:hypothetical protein
MPPDEENPVPPAHPGGGRRWLLAIIIGVSAVLYTLGVVFGGISMDRRIDTTNLLILGLATLIVILLVKPDIFEHLKRFKLAGFELELEKIKRSQELQQDQLEAIKLLLPLVLQKAETVHLLNLHQAKTTNYAGSEAVRWELRHLATLELIDRIEGKRIQDLKDNLKFDLADQVRLTPFGLSLAEKLEAIAKAKLEEKEPEQE